MFGQLKEYEKEKDLKELDWEKYASANYFASAKRYEDFERQHGLVYHRINSFWSEEV